METINITKDEIMEWAQKMKDEHYRLIQISATRVSEDIFLDYSFGRGYEFKNLKTVIGQGDAVASISAVYYPAFLYENEIHDLYGVEIKHISIDYEGKLYRTAVKNPFNPLLQDKE